MKKIIELVRPYLLVIFGALLILLNLNSLTDPGTLATFVPGIFGTIFGAYYLCAGTCTIVLKEKINPLMKRIMDLISVVAYPALVFITYMTLTVLAYTALGPTGWVISIYIMLATLAMMTYFVMGFFIKNELIKFAKNLTALSLIVAIIVTFLFDFRGTPAFLGNIVIANLAIATIFVYILITYLMKGAEIEEGLKEEPLKEEVVEEEPKEEIEEQPKEDEKE